LQQELDNRDRRLGHVIWWTTNAYHSKPGTGRFRDSGPDWPRTNWRGAVKKNIQTEVWTHLVRSRGSGLWQIRMALECVAQCICKD